MTAPNCCSRRDFLGLSCGAWVAGALALAPAGVRRAFGQDDPDGAYPLLRKPWGYATGLGDGAVAMIATPFTKSGADMTTLSNGGVIPGKDATLVVEGTNTPKGAAWISDASETLTQRRPGYVALTHFHPDHSAGLPGYQRGAEGPKILATRETRRLLLEKLHKDPPEQGDARLTEAPRRLLLPDVLLPDDGEPTTIDLGGRVVRLVPRAGHTPSDLTIELDEPRVVWCGDLFFHGLFPYFGDALPSRLTKTVKALLAEKFDTYVPGHGPKTDAKGLAPYVELLEHVEDAARAAVAKGTPAAEAWKTYEIPEKLGNWRFFRPDITRFAFEAWERELR